MSDLDKLLAELVKVEPSFTGDFYISIAGSAVVDTLPAIQSGVDSQAVAAALREKLTAILRRHPEALRELLGDQALPNPPHWHRCTRGDEHEAHDFECNDSSCYVWDSGNQGHDFEGYPQPCLAHAAAKEPT
jgi:hypothetical protein